VILRRFITWGESGWASSRKVPMMKKKNHRMRFLAIAAVVAVMVAAVPGAALAQTDSDVPAADSSGRDRAVDRPLRDRDLGTAKERIQAAIEKRLQALERMSEGVAGNEHIPANHEAHLQNDYREATRILEGAAQAVEDAETLAELREAISGAFSETLVFALLTPKTHLVVRSHMVVAISERVSGFTENLQGIIERLSEAGHDMTAAQTALNEAKAFNTDAGATAEPVAGTVIDLDPEDWPDPAQETLRQGRSTLEAARELLRQTREKIQETIAAIRAALSSDEA
jgi:hypothetical protein